MTDRNAAAAAADEMLAFGGGRARNAWAAAVAALDRVVWSSGTALCRLALLPLLRENMLGMLNGYRCRQPNDAVNAKHQPQCRCCTKECVGAVVAMGDADETKAGNVMGFRGNASWRGTKSKSDAPETIADDADDDDDAADADAPRNETRDAAKKRFRETAQ